MVGMHEDSDSDDDDENGDNRKGEQVSTSLLSVKLSTVGLLRKQ